MGSSVPSFNSHQNISSVDKMDGSQDGASEKEGEEVDVTADADLIKLVKTQLVVLTNG